MSKDPDKPHIYLSNDSWRMRYRGCELIGPTLESCFWAARMVRRSQMIRTAGAEANRLADARPYVKPRAG